MRIYELTDMKLRASLVNKLRMLRDNLSHDSSYMKEKYGVAETDVELLNRWIHAIEALVPIVEQQNRVDDIMKYANELYTALKDTKQL